jgi:hypothetical protein
VGGWDIEELSSFRCNHHDGSSEACSRVLYIWFGLAELYVKPRGKTLMLSINRHKVNNSTQLNFTSPTGKSILADQ